MNLQIFASTYVALILAGRREFDQVPETVKGLVRADLEALGYDFGQNV